MTVTLKGRRGLHGPVARRAMRPPRWRSPTTTRRRARVLSVDDATGKENGRLPVMPFTVRLSAPAHGCGGGFMCRRGRRRRCRRTPRVDYTPASYALLFRAGETEKQVWVMIHNDSHDEEPETFEVVLSKAQGRASGQRCCGCDDRERRPDAGGVACAVRSRGCGAGAGRDCGADDGGPHAGPGGAGSPGRRWTSAAMPQAGRICCSPPDREEPAPASEPGGQAGQVPDCCSGRALRRSRVA